MAYYFRAVVCRSNVRFVIIKMNQALNKLQVHQNVTVNIMYITDHQRSSAHRCDLTRSLCFRSGAEPRSAAAGLAPGNLAVRWARRGLLPLHRTFSLHRDSSFLTCRTARGQFHVSIKINQRYCNSECSADSQQVVNFFLRFNAFHAESKRPLHRECGFIRLQPGTNRVAFIIAQNSGVWFIKTFRFIYITAYLFFSFFNLYLFIPLSGLVEIEEGELTGQQLTLHSAALARTSFAKQPHVQQVS